MGGRFYFSVKVALPIIGHIVTYEGWLLDTTDAHDFLLDAVISR
jgi:hypothetical protein